MIEYEGENNSLRGWERKTGIHFRTIHERLKTGWSIEKALTTPVRKYTRICDMDCLNCIFDDCIRR